jgi:hypothetical protein
MEAPASADISSMRSGFWSMNCYAMKVFEKREDAKMILEETVKSTRGR